MSVLSLFSVHYVTHTSAAQLPDTDRLPYPGRSPRRSSCYSYELGTVDIVHVGSTACPTRYHWQTLRRNCIFVARTQPLKKPVQPPQTLLEWLASMHIPVPDNVLSCHYLQTQQVRLWWNLPAAYWRKRVLYLMTSHSRSSGQDWFGWCYRIN